MSIKRVCVFCASSHQVHPEYFDAANRLGKELAKQDVTIIYGGGGAGLMGEVATAALAEGAKSSEFCRDSCPTLSGATPA